jgi:uncharacterized protein
VPALTARVTDAAHLLPPARARALEERLAAFERETSHQLAVLTVPSLEGEPIESFALRVAERWQLGQKGLDNGMLPDAVAKRVLEDVMFPRLRAGDAPGGIEAAAEALMGAARGEQIPAERRPQPLLRPRAQLDPLPTVFFAALLASFFSLPFRRRARPLGALIGGGVSGLCVWLLLASVAWAALAGLLGAWFALAGPTGMGRRRGGFGLPGGGGFGGGGFGGGFGGGGGGFGGGGASGRW